VKSHNVHFVGLPNPTLSAAYPFAMTSEYMRRALALAESVLGTTSPNPSVGCVIVRDDRVIAEGATRPPGGLHADGDQRHAVVQRVASTPKDSEFICAA
jgi:pyrimidine deaminase RibD-like protein